MKLPLSNRLLACCNLVHPGDRVADVGCDHGYLSIHLLLSGIARSVIASDINEKPLDSARRNAAKYGVSDKITFHLSSGVRHIPHNFDVMVCAGMGADTIMAIFDDAPWLKEGKHRVILQCQSKRPELRRYLNRHGYRILRETLAQDGRFLYPIMEVAYEPGEVLSPADFYISPALRESGSPLLPDFLDHVAGALTKAAEGVARSGGEPDPELLAVISQLNTWRDEYGNRS